jgi:hypothetical protein
MEPSITSDFNLDALRLSQDFIVMSGAKKRILTIPVRKPNRQWFIRVRPGDEWRLSVGLINFKDENETYLVIPELYEDLSHEVTPTLLLIAINRQNVLFIWPIKQPDSRGNLDSWNRSASNIALVAEKNWIRVVPNSQLQGYDVFEAVANFNGPIWPNLSLREIIELAFKDKLINSLDHPAIKRLGGLI